MKNKELSLFSLSKITTYEILIEEQLEQLETVRFRYFKRYFSSQESLKRRFIISKIFGAILFGILPIIPLLTYFEVLDFINEGTILIEFVLFAGSLLFAIFFLFQFFNFFLMAMLNTMKILSGNIFTWFETLPIPRKKLKKLILWTIIRSLDIPLIVITITFPIMMLIGTQNLMIFLICIGISFLNTIFSFSILILFCERMNKVLNINEINSKRTHIIRLINLISYVLIVIISVFFIQWALGSLETFFRLFGQSTYPGLVVLILSIIPFPIAPGYLISSFIAPNRIPFHLWYNIIIGAALFLILTFLVYQKLIVGIKKTSYSKFKEKNRYVSGTLQSLKDSIKIKIRSPVRAHIRKDLIISFRNIKNFLSVVMPIVIGFIFTFTYNNVNLGGVTPFELDYILNLYVIIGFNIIISGIIVNGLLNIEEAGVAVLGGLPLIPRNQAKAKLILMFLIQTLTVIAPSLMYLGTSEFIISILTALLALPFVLLFLFLMLVIRVYLFGKAKNIYLIEEVLPEKKVMKWMNIFLIEYLIFFLLISFSSMFLRIQSQEFTILFFVLFLIIGFIFVNSIFRQIFPPSRKLEKKITAVAFEKAPMRPHLEREDFRIWLQKNPKALVLVSLVLNLIFNFMVSFIPFSPYPSSPMTSSGYELYMWYYFIASNISYMLFWVLLFPLIFTIPSENHPIKNFMKKATLGEVKSVKKKNIGFSVMRFLLNYFLIILIFLANYFLLLYLYPYYPNPYFPTRANWFNYMLNYLLSDFCSYFWRLFIFLGVIFELLLRELNSWRAIRLNALLYSISYIFPILFTNQTIDIYSFLIEILYMFLTGLLFSYIYMKTENLLITVSFAVSLNTLFRFFLSNLMLMLF